MVYRLYVEKKPGFDHEAQALLRDLRSFLQIEGLERLRLLNRYDVENIDRALFERVRGTVFSEPQVDDVTDALPDGAGYVFAVEYLPGQFDQRADSAAQCVQLCSQGERPAVRTARVYMLYGNVSEQSVAAIKKYVINPVESREATLDPVLTLKTIYKTPDAVPVLTGFTSLDDEGLLYLITRYGLAMDLDDIRLCRDHFAAEKRDPTLTELRMLDTYWSDHCRHTTFLTRIERVSFEHPQAQAAYARYMDIREKLGVKKPVCLMDLATIGAKYLKHEGLLNDLDESDEINACTVKVDVDVDGETQKWLLLFKNETHNHPTEIEPFGGAATCIGGAIRDPLSGRGYVYQAMRVTGAADPLAPVERTLPGKLPQRKLVVTAANGYSSYGNQIGLATGLVDEIYHPGYAAKRMEIGAVVGAVPVSHVRREEPAPGDLIVLLGGRTGRDGCGGATGSSKAHNTQSLETCGAEVQKGNAPEERKLQRLFRNPEATRLIKRCNDFGAGGVSVAIGELADGLEIDLNAVPKKYEGLDGTELAISESQERMAVALAPEDAPAFMALAASENLEATVVARVTAEKRLVMRWNGEVIVDVSREFLNSNGAPKTASAHVTAPKPAQPAPAQGGFAARMAALAGSLEFCSRRGLAERFDSTVGAGSVLMPFGGRRQRTPAQVMAAKLPVDGETDACSVMSYGFSAQAMERDPYRGAYLAVMESAAKLAASGAGIEGAHLTFQEYFQRLYDVPERWGTPLSALLGALDAQLELGLAAIGGKDSMSGSFEDLDVPPTLVSFAVNMCSAADVISPEFKQAGSTLRLLTPGKEGMKAAFARVTGLIRQKKVRSAWACGFGGVAEGLLKMGMGNRLGARLNDAIDADGLFAPAFGAFILETEADVQDGVLLGEVTQDYALTLRGETADMTALETAYEAKLEPVFPCNIPAPEDGSPALLRCEAKTRVAPRVKIARPRVLIPVFPGTNCEYDTARALRRFGAEPEICVLGNLTPAAVADAAERFARGIDNAQIIFIPGGFSGGDEPDGSAKFITAFFRNPRVSERVAELLAARDGLIGGICNGFQALIKLGLLPYGEIRDARPDDPTLTFNRIGRHQSRLVRTRVASNLSPWLMHAQVDEIHLTPVSHGEGRFVADDAVIARLAAQGQIATQYVDEQGVPSMDVAHNPNGSACAIEGITSPDGRVFGRMAHSERFGENLYKNVPGADSSLIFRGALDYFG